MEKQNVSERLSRGLKHERLAYKIYGIVALVLAIFIMIFGIISSVAGVFLTANEEYYTEDISFSGNIDIYDEDANVSLGDGRIEIYDDNSSVYIDGYEIEFDENAAAALGGAGVTASGASCLVFRIILLAVAIVNLVMASKVGKYRLSEVLTVKHASSVGSIVIAAIFNEIALVFVIINFVIAKKNRAMLEG